MLEKSTTQIIVIAIKDNPLESILDNSGFLMKIEVARKGPSSIDGWMKHAMKNPTILDVTKITQVGIIGDTNWKISKLKLLYQWTNCFYLDLAARN